MDNLLEAIDTLSLKKAKGCHMDWLSRGANLPQIGLMHDSGARQKVIGLAPESAIGFDRNQ
jgi:hypothetical protein